MTRRRQFGYIIAALSAAAVGAVLLRHFPWVKAGEALVAAGPQAIIMASLLNLAAHVVRGGAWHYLLRPKAPHRLQSALIATVAGEAVSCVTISLGGEVVRATLMVRRDAVPFRAAVESIAASRVVEGIALAGFVALGTPFLPTTSAVIMLRYASWAVVALLLLLLATRAGPAMRQLLPNRLAALVMSLFGPNAGEQLRAPVLLGLLNWLLEWATFHVCIVATCGPLPYAASLLALLAANIGGLMRLTPGNAGVLQASVGAALVPLGVAPVNALAAGLLLQAVQSLPVMAAGFLAGGGSVWRSISSQHPHVADASQPT